MMSKPCTIGTPAAIITAICRLKTAMSRALIVFPAAPNRGLPFAFTEMRIDALSAQFRLDEGGIFRRVFALYLDAALIGSHPFECCELADLRACGAAIGDVTRVVAVAVAMISPSSRG